MRWVFGLLLALIVGVVNLVLGMVALVEGSLRGLMTQAGMGAQMQRPVLIVAAILLIVGALRVFGRALGLLATVFLILLLLHLLQPGLGHLHVLRV